MFPAGGGGGGDDYDLAAVEQFLREHDSNPIRMGHTFGMLPYPKIDEIGMSPLPMSHMDVQNLHSKKEAEGLVSPPHSAVVYRLHDIHTVFLALLLIQVRVRQV